MITLKTRVGTVPANETEVLFTDVDINNNSIIEIYYDNNDVYTVETNQTGTTVRVTTSEHTYPVGIKLFINNIDGAYNPIEITNNMIMGDLLAKIKVNNIDYEIHRGEIKPEDINYFSQYHTQGITQKKFNDDIEQGLRDVNANLNRRIPEPTTSDIGGVLYNSSNGNEWKKLDSSDILYDENSTVYSAMGDIDSLSTTSKNLVGAINEVASSGGGIVYSETETIIGTYKGQTLYRRCISGTLTQPDTHTDLTDITGSFNVINWGGYYTIASGIRVYTGYASASAYFSLYYHIAGNCYRLYHPVRNNEVNTFDIFIEYTKVV